MSKIGIFKEIKKALKGGTMDKKINIEEKIKEALNCLKEIDKAITFDIEVNRGNSYLGEGVILSHILRQINTHVSLLEHNANFLLESEYRRDSIDKGKIKKEEYAEWLKQRTIPDLEKLGVYAYENAHADWEKLFKQGKLSRERYIELTSYRHPKPQEKLGKPGNVSGKEEVQ